MTQGVTFQAVHAALLPPAHRRPSLKFCTLQFWMKHEDSLLLSLFPFKHKDSSFCGSKKAYKCHGTKESVFFFFFYLSIVSDGNGSYDGKILSSQQGVVCSTRHSKFRRWFLWHIRPAWDTTLSRIHNEFLFKFLKPTWVIEDIQLFSDTGKSATLLFIVLVLVWLTVHHYCMGLSPIPFPWPLQSSLPCTFSRSWRPYTQTAGIFHL